jgi:membrane protein implicated in regulation of membrane protease activity
VLCSLKAKVILKVAGLIGVLALISAGYCFWLMTIPLSYDWVLVVLIGFVVAVGVFIIAAITSFIVFIRLRRLPRAPNPPQIRPTI